MDTRTAAALDTWLTTEPEEDTTMQILEIETRELPDEYPDASWLEQPGFEDRLASYEHGDFSLIGVDAIARVVINETIQTIRSGGLWGIESDADENYLTSVAEEELNNLCSILVTMGFTSEHIAEARDNAI